MVHLGRWFVILFCIGQCSCGEALNPESYRGEPLLRVEIRTTNVRSLPTTAPVLVNLFWSPSGETRVRVSQLIEHSGSASRVLFPPAFELLVYEAPFGEVFVPGTSYGIALVLAYHDKNEDGVFDDADEIIGGTPETAFVYTTRPLAASESPLELALQAGFSAIPLPARCGERAVEVEQGEDCDFQTGGPCEIDGDCGTSGLCLRKTPGEPDQWYPGGYCTKIVIPGECTPREARATVEAVTVWLRECGEETACPGEQLLCVSTGSALLGEGFCWPRDAAPLNGGVLSFNRSEDTACETTVGMPCREDVDCLFHGGNGICSHLLNGSAVTEGYCTINGSFPGCNPSNALVALAVTTRWMRGCVRDSDCRVNEGYTCHPYDRVCRPKQLLSLELFDVYRPEGTYEDLCEEAS